MFVAAASMHCLHRTKMGAPVCAGPSSPSSAHHPHTPPTASQNSLPHPSQAPVSHRPPHTQTAAHTGGVTQQGVPPSLMMRLIDDFLAITPSRTAAEALATRLLQGGSMGGGLWVGE